MSKLFGFKSYDPVSNTTSYTEYRMGPTQNYQKG